MRIGAVPHPAVLLAFTDRAGIEQNRPRPSLDRPERGPAILGHQHQIIPCHATGILGTHLSFRLLTQGRDSESSELAVFHLFRGRLWTRPLGGWWRVFLFAGRHDPQRAVRKRPLQQLGLVPWRPHPDIVCFERVRTTGIAFGWTRPT